MKKIYGLVLLAILMVGCTEKEFKAKSIDYYKNNPKVTKQRVEECKKNGYTSENEKIDCHNATIAYNKITKKSNDPVIGDERQVTDW